MLPVMEEENGRGRVTMVPTGDSPKLVRKEVVRDAAPIRAADRARRPTGRDAIPIYDNVIDARGEPPRTDVVLPSRPAAQNQAERRHYHQHDRHGDPLSSPEPPHGSQSKP